MTSTFPIGSGFQAYSPDLDFYKALAWWKPFRSGAHVVVINNMNDKGRILDAQKQLEGSLIVARYIVTVNDQGHEKELDGALHTKPLGPGDTNYYLVSPLNYMNLIEPMGDADTILYWANEPSGKVDGLTFDRLIKHTVEGIQLADQRKRHLCVLNWGAGHPNWNVNGLDERLDTILMALHYARIQHYWGIHLYDPIDTYKALEALEQSCIRLDIPMPKVIITEWGYDSGFPGDPLNGYKTRGKDGRGLGSFTIDAIKGKLRRFIENGTVVAVVGFSEGGSPKWFNYDYSQDQGYKDRLTEALQRGEVDFSPKRITATIPKYQSGVMPASAEYPLLYRVDLGSLKYRNVRVLPEEASSSVTEIHTGDELLMYDSPTAEDNLMRRWKWVQIMKGQGEGKFGWLYTDGISLIPILPPGTPRDTKEVTQVPSQPTLPTVPPVVTVPPITLPPLPAPNTLTADQLVKLYQKLDAAIAAFTDLSAYVKSLVPIQQPAKPEGVPNVP